ncbi:MAG TPA: segregation/condensation protein A, partial [Streptosporangiaceae bacterium]|nr:segregation/condensation protein A [Streptosporangiaceae bacterium]
GPHQFAEIAAKVLAPRRPPVVSTAHLHMPRTTVQEQAVIVAAKLRAAGRASFRELAQDCEDTYEIVARFLAVLDLYRDKCVSFEQDAPLGDLHITWLADNDAADVEPSADTASEPARPDDRQR